MSDSPRTPEAADPPMSVRRKIATVVVILVLAIAAIVLFIRLSAPHIPPGQIAPPSHFTAPCEWCHVRAADAPKIEIR